MYNILDWGWGWWCVWQNFYFYFHWKPIFVRCTNVLLHTEHNVAIRSIWCVLFFAILNITTTKFRSHFYGLREQKKDSNIFYDYVKMKNNNSTKHENTLNNFHRSFIAELNFFFIFINSSQWYIQLKKQCNKMARDIIWCGSYVLREEYNTRTKRTLLWQICFIFYSKTLRWIEV